MQSLQYLFVSAKRIDNSVHRLPVNAQDKFRDQHVSILSVLVSLDGLQGGGRIKRIFSVVIIYVIWTSKFATNITSM